MKVEILKTKEECDHVQFLITETSNPGRVSVPEIAEIETLSLGTYFAPKILIGPIFRQTLTKFIYFTQFAIRNVNIYKRRY